MNPPYPIIFSVAAMMLVMFIFMGIWASRYTKVAPNQVLIVSGRKVRLPDGRFVDFRFVKGGGTFVWPVFERADVLSLEVISVEMQRSRAQTAAGQTVEADCVAQVKINGDDASILAAAEHFLGKSQAEIKIIVQPVLEKHLSGTLGNLSIQEVIQNPVGCAARVQTAAAGDLGKMGLGLISFTIRNAHAA
jgi:flotillin